MPEINELQNKIQAIRTQAQADTLIANLTAEEKLQINIEQLKKKLKDQVTAFSIDQINDREKEETEKRLADARITEEVKKYEQQQQNILIEFKNLTQDTSKYLDIIIKETKQKNKRLDIVKKELQNDKIIKKDSLTNEILSPDEISTQHEKHKKIIEDQEKVQEFFKSAQEEVEVLKKEKKELINELKNPKLNSTERKNIETNLSFCEAKFEIANDSLEIISEGKKQFEQKFKDYQKELNITKEKIDEIDEIIKSNPAKYHDIKHHGELLKNQFEAITNDGKVHDTPEQTIERNKIKQNKIIDKMKSGSVTTTITSPLSTPNIQNKASKIGYGRG